MEDYNSKYKGSEIDALLDKAKELNVAAVDIGEEVDDVIIEYATTQYVDDSIARAITTTLNTEV